MRPHSEVWNLEFRICDLFGIWDLEFEIYFNLCFPLPSFSDKI